MAEPNHEAVLRCTHEEPYFRHVLFPDPFSGMERAAVSELPGSDPRKVAMAHAWTAEKLGMRSAANVSQHLRRLARGEVKLTKEAKAWLEQTMTR